MSKQPTEPSTKICPECAEEVKSAAVVCRFCGYNFASKQPSSNDSKTSSGSAGTAANQTRMLILGGIVLVIAVVAVMAFVSSGKEGDTDGSPTGGGVVTDELHALLLNSATAQESFLTSNAAYTTDVSALEAEGLSIPPGMSIAVPEASATDYCLEATDVQGTTAFYSSDSGRTRVGSCP